MLEQKRIQQQAVLISLLALAVVGCTTLVSVHYDPSKKDPPVDSYRYALPEAMVTVLYTVTLTKCGETTRNVRDVPSIGVKISATITPSYPVDPNQYFYVPTTSLQGAFKNANVKFTTASDGTLQGVNGELADQSLQVVGAGLQSVATIAGDVLTAGVHVPRNASPSSTQFNGTYDEPLDFANLTSKQKKLIPNDTTKQIFLDSNACSGTAQAALKDYTKAQTELKSASQKASAAKSAQATSAAEVTLNQDTSTMADALKKVSFTIPIAVVPTANQFKPVEGALSQPRLMKAEVPVDLWRYIKALWVDPDKAKKTVYVTINGAANSIPKDPQSTDDGEIAIYVLRSTTATQPAGASDALPAQPTAATDPASDANGQIKGLVLRQPAAGLARTCLGKCLDPDTQGVVITQTTSANADLAPSVPITLPQLGKRILVPLHTHVGDDVTISATLSADGAPTVLSLANTSTLAQGLTAVSGAANSYSTALGAENTAIGQRNTALTAQSTLSTTNATLNDTKLKAQADCLVQQAAIVKAGGTPVAGCQ
ncbi:hypothetical protein [Burkholderia paludis]|uniref:hypothetical protein n=1 Tax=Burkholderia paludis TaxID=1506587 RepID=UPI001269E4E1|nr:hypothetical protein [Burkholderia paludis]